MRVVVAPDSFKGTLTAREAADAIAAGWRAVRPDDEIDLRPMSDGGDGLLDVVRRDGDRVIEVEVAGPLGHPQAASFLLRGETAIIESAQACGLSLVPEASRDPLHTTTYGVGQLLTAARGNGVTSMLVGLGGSATVDGGAGALTALGFRLRVVDGSGLKVGGGELHRLDRVESTWVGEWNAVDIELLADVRTTLPDAPARFGPQKGATPEGVQRLEEGLERFADVVERDLDVTLRSEPGTGAAGGLGFGLAAGVGGQLVDGARRVGELVGLPGILERADLVIVGEGELDATSAEGKVVGALLGWAQERGIDVTAVAGVVRDQLPGIADVERSGRGNGDAYGAVVEAARRLAARTH